MRRVRSGHSSTRPASRGPKRTSIAHRVVVGLQLVVSDIHQARDELAGRGVEVSEVQEFPWGAFVFFADPDDNRWSVQQITNR